MRLLGSPADIIDHMRGLPADAEVFIAYPCHETHHASSEGCCTVQLTAATRSYPATVDLPERIVLETR